MKHPWVSTLFVLSACMCGCSSSTPAGGDPDTGAGGGTVPPPADADSGTLPPPDVPPPDGSYPCRADGDGKTTAVFINRCGSALEVRGSDIEGATVEAKWENLPAAVQRLKQGATAKFDETIEVAMRLGVDPRHAEQQVRGTVVLPHGTGKKVRVLVLTKGEKEREAREAGADFAGSDEFIKKINEDQKKILDSVKREIGMASMTLQDMLQKTAPKASINMMVHDYNKKGFACALEGSNFDDECESPGSWKSVGTVKSASDRTKIKVSFKFESKRK